MDAAIAALTEAIKRNEKDHVAFSKRSAAYLEKGEALSALYDAERCIALKVDWVQGYHLKGRSTFFCTQLRCKFLYVCM